MSSLGGTLVGKPKSTSVCLVMSQSLHFLQSTLLIVAFTAVYPFIFPIMKIVVTMEEQTPNKFNHFRPTSWY